MLSEWTEGAAVREFSHDKHMVQSSYWAKIHRRTEVAMDDIPVCPKSWAKVGLAILPGLWIAFCQSEILIQFYRQTCFVVLAIVALGILGSTLITKRRLTAWSLTSLGALFWVGWKWIWWLLSARSPNTRWILGLYERIGIFFYRRFGINIGLPSWIAFLALSVCSIYFAYKKSGLRASRLGWGLLSFAVLVTMTHICIDILPHPWLSFGMVLGLSLLFMSVIIGFPLSKREGIATGLFIVACEVTSFDMMFLNFLHIIRVYVHESPNIRLELALFILSYLPVICFLIIIPIGVLRSRTEQGQKWWLLLPSLLTLVGINVVRGLALQGTPNEYTVSIWLHYGRYILQLWLPLLLATALYARQGSDTLNAH
jgi:hypothetical protein